MSDDLEFANKANIEAARKFKAERDVLVKALEQIAEGTRDEVYPFRAMGRDQMKETARTALASIKARP